MKLTFVQIGRYRFKVNMNARSQMYTAEGINIWGINAEGKTLDQLVDNLITKLNEKDKADEIKK